MGHGKTHDQIPDFATPCQNTPLLPLPPLSLTPSSADELTLLAYFGRTFFDTISMGQAYCMQDHDVWFFFFDG
jgi:hypothetical protein